MPKIRAFKGIRYNPEKTDLGKNLCPPYDVITPQLSEKLYKDTPCNAIRLEFGRQFPKDSPEDNRYTRAQADMARWRAEGLLIEERMPALYYHEHFYTVGDRDQVRRGIIASVKIDEDENRTIFPHETTHKGPKVDRLHLLNAVKTNLSCVFGVYSDVEKLVESKIKPALADPVVDVEMRDGERHKFWTITDAGLIAGLAAMLSDRNVLIADGHHRYETARAYRDRMRAATGKLDGEQPFDYVMMYLTNMDEGLFILPTHRVIRDSMGVGLVDLEYRIKEIFNMVPFDNRRSFLKALNEGGRGKIGLYVNGIHRYYLLEIMHGDELCKYMRDDLPEKLRKLDLSILHSCIIEPILGIDPSMADKRITYVSDAKEALDMVEKDNAHIAFLLNPNSIQEVMEIAEAGLKMPQKSTFFYPKIPTGLVFHPVE